MCSIWSQLSGLHGLLSFSHPPHPPGYTIHGTHGLLVQGNTGFHIQGHCFYLEDGVEERNRMDGNFAGFVHPLGRGNTCDEIGSVFGADPVYQARSSLLQTEAALRRVGTVWHLLQLSQVA